MSGIKKVKTYNKSILLVIDALRYDIISNKRLFPTLYKNSKKWNFY